MALQNVRISSQGKGPWDLQIRDADTNELLEGITRVEVVWDPNINTWVAKLSIANPILDIIVSAEITKEE